MTYLYKTINQSTFMDEFTRYGPDEDIDDFTVIQLDNGNILAAY